MDTLRRMVDLLAICCICIVGSFDEDAEIPDIKKDAGVKIEITELDVDDSVFTLNYNISNSSDREAWVCSESGRIPFEVFLSSDRRTLMIRKRLDVPTDTIWRAPPLPGKYVRLVPGASLAESVQVVLPVSSTFLYTIADTTEVARTVTRIALEVGYYHEDLPALIRSIFAVVDASGLTSQNVPVNILNTYFRGFRVRSELAGFEKINPDPYGRGYVYIRYSYQALTDEKILRVDVNDVSIPYVGSTIAPEGEERGREERGRVLN